MTLEQVAKDIYRIPIPLPNNPLKATNSYLIFGKDRNLLVDTGFNRQECWDAMEKALQKLQVNMDNTDIFVTHLHSDHAGLVSHLSNTKNAVYMSVADGQVVEDSRDSFHWAMFKEFFRFSGLTASGMDGDVNYHPGYRYAAPNFDRMVLVPDGHIVSVGDYTFRCIETKGHTPGHMCLYDEDKRLLLSGDHILGKITPNITLWQFNNDVLGQYLESLDKIAALEVDLVLPGHRHIITDCRQRINELKIHHDNRLQDVINIIGDQKLNAVEVARWMKWDMSYRNWDEFPWGQKLFATGEALSHLYHLVQKNVLTMEWDNNIVYFHRK